MKLINLKNSLFLTLITLIFTGCIPQNQPSVFNDINKFDLNMKYKNITNNSQEIKIQKPQKPQKNKITSSTPPMAKAIKLNAKYNIKIDKVSTSNTNKALSINVENIPVADFIKLIFGQILNLNYSISPDIEKNKQKITLNMNEKVSINEFFKIIENILQSYNIKIDKKDNIYYFSKGKTEKIKKLSNYFFYGRSIPKNINDNVIISMMIPSYYIDFTNIEWMLKRFYLSPNAYVVNLREYNVLIITDKVSYIKKALNFINIMDVPTLKNKIPYILKLKYINMNTFIQRLKTILPNTGVPIAKNLNDLGLLITPIPELNSILLISDKKEWINIVKYWKDKLDIININSEEPQIFIYKPKNRSAKELVPLITNIFQVLQKNSKNKKITSKKQKVKVIADNKRNTLIIYAIPSEYKKIYTMLQKLDTLPKQVLIQVTIAEITLKDSLQYGFEWFLRNRGASTTSSIGTLGNLGLGAGGLVGSVINNSGDFQAILNALAQKNLINVLSSPKLIVLDNQSANINVGTQVPVLTSSTTTKDNTATSTSQSVQYRTTGITLNVTPIIHSNGSLTLQINQTVSDPQPNNTSNISSPIILNRSISTKVILKSNQALMLGGLIRQSTGKTINKIPLLGDIPYIGNLFKTTSYSKDRTELIIIVKPIIISNINEANDITSKFQNLLTTNQE